MDDKRVERRWHRIRDWPLALKLVLHTGGIAAALALGLTAMGYLQAAQGLSERAEAALSSEALMVLAACSAPAALPPDEPPRTAPVSTPPATTTAVPMPTTIAMAVAPSDLRFSIRGWRTNFSSATVPLSELESGGPSRDGIPPIDQPKFVGGAEATAWLKDEEPVIAFERNGEARAYPLQILIWHEIVDDNVASTPVLITFCPLCNTAIAFDRRVDGKPLRFRHDRQPA